MRRTRCQTLFLRNAVFGIFLVLISFSGAYAEELLLSGSSMLLPLDRVWGQAYGKDHSDIRILTSGTGSGTGIFSTVSGDVSIGASDIFLSEKNLKKDGNIVLIPVALEGMIPVVNLPLRDKSPLKMNGTVLAGLFLGTIRFWDDPALAKLNPGRTLTHLPVRVFRRSDSSGTTFVLTDYLERTSTSWRDSVGRDILPDWPAFPGASGVFGSAAMATAVRNNSGSIGYVGLGWVQASHLSPVALENREGRFVAGTVHSIMAAGRAAFFKPTFPGGFNRSIVWNLPGQDVYPASGVEFWMVDTNLPGQTMKKLRDLIEWVLTTGQSPDFTVRNGFAPLPDIPGNPRLEQLLEEILPGNTYRPVSGG